MKTVLIALLLAFTQHSFAECRYDDINCNLQKSKMLEKRIEYRSKYGYENMPRELKNSNTKSYRSGSGSGSGSGSHNCANLPRNYDPQSFKGRTAPICVK